MQQLQDADVPVEAFLVVEPADNVHLSAAGAHRLLAPRNDLLVAHHIAFGVAQVGPECAERAAVDAHVGRIQVRVDVVIGHATMPPLPREVGQRPDIVQRHVAAQQVQAVIKRQPLARLHLGPNLLKRRPRFRPELHAFHLLPSPDVWHPLLLGLNRRV